MDASLTRGLTPPRGRSGRGRSRLSCCSAAWSCTHSEGSVWLGQVSVERWGAWEAPGGGLFNRCSAWKADPVGKAGRTGVISLEITQEAAQGMVSSHPAGNPAPQTGTERRRNWDGRGPVSDSSPSPPRGVHSQEKNRWQGRTGHRACAGFCLSSSFQVWL